MEIKNQKFVEQTIKDLENKIFNSYTINQVIFILEEAERTEKQEYIQKYQKYSAKILEHLSTQTDSDNVLLSYCFHFFERLYFILKNKEFKEKYFNFLVEYYFKKISLVKERERLVVNLLYFNNKKIEDLENKYIEKLSRKTLFSFLKFIFGIKRD